MYPLVITNTFVFHIEESKDQSLFRSAHVMFMVLLSVVSTVMVWK